MRTPAGRLRVRGALLGVVVLALLGADIPTLHVHEDATAGLYNEECPLARLATPAWGLPALSLARLAAPLPLVDRPDSLAPAHRPGAPPLPFAARAPPPTA